MTRSRRGAFAAFAVIGGHAVALAVAEAVLRIHQPFPFRIRGSQIRLPVNVVLEIENESNPRLERRIIHRRNSLGFRGPDPPADLKSRLSIIAVGGSTTECFYLSDEDTWPAALGRQLDEEFRGIWVNNAGLDGHSTFGHAQLIRQVIAGIGPRVLLILAGINDLGRRSPTDFDRGTFDGGAPSWTVRMADRSEVVSMIVNLARVARARRFNVGHEALDFARVDMTRGRTAEWEATEEERQAVADYASRMAALVTATRSQQILPVLMTQPALYGAGVDPSSGLDLERALVGSEESGKAAWTRLESYNDAVRQMSRVHNVPLIDVARELPKDSRYFYDWVHFTREGAAAIAALAARVLAPELGRRWPEHRLR